MKHRNRRTLVAALLAGMMILSAGCSGSCGKSCCEKNGSEKISGESMELVGNWRNSAGDGFCLFDDGTGVGFVPGTLRLGHFTWKSLDGCLMMTSHPRPEPSSFVGKYDYELSGSTLTISKGMFQSSDSARFSSVAGGVYKKVKK